MKRPDQPVAIYCHYQLRSKDGPAGSLQIWINATADTWLVVRRPEKEESIGNPVETVCYGVLHENRRLSLILRAEDAKRRTEAFFRPFGRQEALIVAETQAQQAEDRLRLLIFDPTDRASWQVGLDPTDAPPAVRSTPDVEAAITTAQEAAGKARAVITG